MKPLHVLIVEDSQNDADLLQIELERAGYDPLCRRVETAEAMEAALRSQNWDLVIADYVMPHFNGLSALAKVKDMGLDRPFIIVSGHITDDTAVAAMKAGAHDYVMKDNLARLGPAVQRELREADVRREQRRSEEKLKIESTFRQAVENSVPSGITAVDLEGRQTYVNPAFCGMVGWAEQELVGAKPPFVYWPPDEIDVITESLAQVIAGKAPAGGLELRFRRRTGELIDVLTQVTPLKDSFGNITGWVSSATDISQRKRDEVRLAAEHAITRILANAQSLVEAGPGIVQVLLDALQVDVGTLWTIDAKHGQLNPSVMTVRKPSPELQQFVQESRRHSFGPGESLPGRVWRDGRSAWIDDLLSETTLPRWQLIRDVGFSSGFAFPVHSGDTFFAVLEFFSLRHMENDQSLLNMMTAIGSEIGQFIHRRDAEDALRKAHDELEIRVQQRTADLKLANAKLQASITERKRLEHELLEITEKERRRIGLDLHDDLGQRLSGIALMTKGLQLRLAKENADASEDASRIHELVQQAMSHASDLARDLATLDLKENDLPSALQGLASRAKKLFEISCRFKTEGEIPPFEASAVQQLYKIAQEAVTNAIKHGKAKKVNITLKRNAGDVHLEIENNGLPFPDLSSHSTGMGLRIMNYRASLIGATLEVKGLGTRGTIVSCTIPTDVKKVAPGEESKKS